MQNVAFHFTPKKALVKFIKSSCQKSAKRWKVINSLAKSKHERQLWSCFRQSTLKWCQWAHQINHEIQEHPAEINLNPENVELLQIKVINESQLKKLMDDDEYEKFVQELNPKDLMVKETLREAVMDMSGKKEGGEHVVTKEAVDSSEKKHKEGDQVQPKPKEDVSKGE